MKISVRVKPNSKEAKVVSLENNTFIVYVKSPPVKGKANKELIGVLAEYFNIPKANIKIVSGLNSKNKIIEIKEK